MSTMVMFLANCFVRATWLSRIIDRLRRAAFSQPASQLEEANRQVKKRLTFSTCLTLGLVTLNESMGPEFLSLWLLNFLGYNNIFTCWVTNKQV